VIYKEFDLDENDVNRLFYLDWVCGQCPPYWDYLLVKMDREQDSNFQSITMGIDRTYPH
jgi:hypothetical protein